MRESKVRTLRPRLPLSPPTFRKPPQDESTEQGILSTWKEISEYSGRGVRTLQRWEHAFGFPVHRPDERNKSVVVTTRHEVDEWFRTRPLRSMRPTTVQSEETPNHAKELTQSARKLEVEAKKLLNTSVQMNQRIRKALETARKKYL